MNEIITNVGGRYVVPPRNDADTKAKLVRLIGDFGVLLHAYPRAIVFIGMEAYYDSDAYGEDFRFWCDFSRNTFLMLDLVPHCQWR